MINQVDDTSTKTHGTLTLDYPKLAEEWDEEKNGIPASLVVKWDHKKETWWKCSACSLGWPASLWRRKQGAYKCPVCFGNKIIPGINDFATIFPEYALLWDYNKNELAPTSIGSTSKEFWFRSDLCGHSWKMSTRRVAEGAGGCRVCSSRVIISGVNDFASKYPNLAKSWSSKNEKLASEVPIAGSKKYIWNDVCGHEWSMTTGNRRSQNCPFCSGKKILQGFNDLESKYPECASEWHPKNSMKASEVFASSSKEYWWICGTCTNEWKASPNSRHLGTRELRCPKCPRMSGTSKKEISVGDLLISWDYKIERNKKFQRKRIRKELDIYLPELNLGIEFNGTYWHRPIYNEEHQNVTKYKQLLKWSFFTVFHKIPTVFIWETDWDQERDKVEEALKRFLQNPDDVDTILMKLEEFPNGK